MNLQGLSIPKLESMQKELEEQLHLEKNGSSPVVCSAPSPRTITEQLYNIREEMLGTLDLSRCIADKIRNDMPKANTDGLVNKSSDGIAPSIDEIESILCRVNSILNDVLKTM